MSMDEIPGMDTPSAVREWLCQRPSYDVEQIRAEDSPLSRAILGLAQLSSEYVGYHWDSMPWRSDDGRADQSYYVTHAAVRMMYLVEHGLVTVPNG